MEDQSIHHLLAQVSAIGKKYEGIAEVTGENFNVFKILGLTANEVRTHTAFIKELLNPKGSHLQKEIFLELFCHQLQIEDFNCKDAFLGKEYTGRISDDYAEGGYIDILITDNESSIIIENKIYAGDQKAQLKRYFEYGKKTLKPFVLMYLTLDGKDASEWSKGDLTENDFRKMSYSVDILNWLEKCREKATNLPILRETITQYINLIKHLTKQTMNEYMKNEIVSEVMKSSQSIAAAEEIVSNWNDIRLGVLSEFKNRLLSLNSVQDWDLELKFEDNDLGKSESGFRFFKKNWKRSIYFWFDGPDFEHLLMGVDLPSGKGEDLDLNFNQTVSARLAKMATGEVDQNSYWAWVSEYSKWEEIRWKDVPDSFPEMIIETVKEFLGNLEGIEI